MSDGWVDVGSSDGWEDVGKNINYVDQIPGQAGGPVPLSGSGRYKPKDTSEAALDGLKGIGETALNVATGLPVGLIAPFVGMASELSGKDGNAAAGKFMQDYTYMPRSDFGQKAAGAIGEVVNQVALPLSGMTPLLSPHSRLPKGKRIGSEEPAPTSKLGALEQQLKTVPDEGWVDVGTQMELPLETSAQSVAEMQGRGTGQMDLFAPKNEPLARTIPEQDMSPLNPVRPMDTTQQAALFDQDSQGRVANPYEASTGDWRIDENGIPIKADLSMELQNLENPLQRNLWGDELPPKMSPEGMGLQGVADMTSQQGRPLTEAIDSMGWAQRRGAINSQLKGAVEPSGALEGAMLEANSPFVPPSQRGALNMDVFDPAFKLIKELEDGIKLVMKGSRQGPVVFAVNPAGKVVGELALSHDQLFAPPKGADNFEAGWVTTDPKKITSSPDSSRLGPTTKSEYPGLATKMYQFAAEQGDIVRSGAQTPEGAAMWDRFEAKGISKGGKIPWSQRGAIDLGNATEPKPGDAITSLNENSPAVRAAAQALQQDKSRAAAARLAGIEGYKSDIDTPEKVVAAITSGQDRDITKFQRVRGETVSPGINSLVINTNNPFLKFVRDKTRSVFLESEELTRQYVTGEDGIKVELEKMSQAEKNEALAALQLGDKNIKYITREQMETAGFNETQIRFVEKVYEMDKAKLELWNKSRAEVGLPPVVERPGHFPGVFKGDYKQLVYGKNEDGSQKVLGVIAVDTKWQLEGAREAILKKHPDATFSTVDRRKLGGNGNKADMFSGMNDMLEVLARNNPEFAKIQDLVGEAVKQRADELFQASQHAKDKKGIVGNEGNKPWKSIDENTNDAIKAYLGYWEEGIISHKNLPVETQIKALMDNPLLDAMPEAKHYANAYIRNMTGRDLGTVGDALNKLLDAPFKIMGVGPSVPREIIHQVNKRMSQQLMGFANYVFSGVQLLQMPQMALPTLIKVTGKDPATVTASLGVGFKHLADSLKYEMGVEVNSSALMKGAFEEAKKRGLTHFSEFQEVSKVTQSKAGRTYDKIVDANRVLAERGTRPTVFFAAVDLLKDSGLSQKDIYDIAYNATQRSMIDYSAREKPMMYNRLGVAGQLAGSLQTFKHGSLSHMTEILGAKPNSPKNIMAALSLATVAMAFAGIKGVPFYQEVDEMTKFISDQFFGGRKSIEELVLSNLPEWSKSGALSVATDVNLQSRLSAANVIPDTPMEAVSPYVAAMGRIGGAAIDVAKFRDPLSMEQLAIQMTPSGPLKGLTESAVSVDSKGIPTDKRGEKGDIRSPWDASVRKYSGATSLTEALHKERQYNQMMREASNKAAQKSIIEKAKRAYVQGNLTKEQVKGFLDKYQQRKGDPDQFINTMVEYAQTTKLTKQQRLQGIPANSLSSLYRYQNYATDE